MPSGVYKRTEGMTSSGDSRWNWKGDKVGYRSLHNWIESKLGKPRFCEDCGNRNLRHRQYHWSNTSGLYKRITTDWRRLCAKCHKKFDTANGRWANSKGRPKQHKTQ